MATSVLTSARLTIAFDEGTYTFSRIKPNAARENVHALAMALNSLQSEKPPEKVLHTVTTKIV